MTTVPSSAAMIDPSLNPARAAQRQDRRDGGHQDRSDAGPPALDQRVVVGVALGTQPLDEVEQHDRVGDHDPDEHQEADEGADADGPARDVQRREGADRRERQGEQDDERGDERVEGQDHHQVDEQDRDAHRGEQAAERLGLLRLTPASSTVAPAGMAPAAARASISAWTATRHGARVVAGDLGRDGRRRALVDPGDAALDVGLLDRRDLSERDLARPCRRAGPRELRPR